jgi:O-succinylbenzoic acid--CoA ligase
MPDLPVLTAPALAAATEALPAPERPDAQVLTLLHTSGTTGAPTPVPLTLAQHRASAAAVAARLGLRADDRWLLCLPPDHVGGLAVLLRSALLGHPVRLAEGLDAAALRRLLASAPVTLAPMVPTQLAQLLDGHDGPLVSSLRVLLIGGAACAPELLQRARDAGLPVVPTWGMTEAASQLATLAPDDAAVLDFLAHPGLAGPPLDGVEVRVLDDRGAALPVGVSGRLSVRGAVLGDADWHDTGDRGRLDAEGRVIVEGRLDEVIISGAVNVDAQAVVAALHASGHVREAAVLGLPDPVWGQRVAAAVVPVDGEDAETLPARLDAMLREQLPATHLPRVWRIVNALPRSPLGKLRHNELRALFEARASRSEPRA